VSPSKSSCSSVLAYFGPALCRGLGAPPGAPGMPTFSSAAENSAWPLVAFGMIGTALSGVTFCQRAGVRGQRRVHLSSGGPRPDPGLRASSPSSCLPGLLPASAMFSIYGLGSRARLGDWGWQTAAVFFHHFSRTLGATARLYLVIRILQDISFRQPGRALRRQHLGHHWHDHALHLARRGEDHRLDRYLADRWHAVRADRLHRLCP